MAEDFDPCHFLDVAADAKFRFNIINRHATWFLAQGLDFENREGAAGLQYDFVELAMQPLERVVYFERQLSEIDALSRDFMFFQSALPFQREFFDAAPHAHQEQNESLPKNGKIEGESSESSWLNSFSW